MKFLRSLILIGFALLLVACGGGGGSSGATNTSTSPVVTSNGAVSTLLLVSDKQEISATSISVATVVVAALDAGSARVPKAVVKLSLTGGGILSASTVTTGEGGTASVQVSAPASDQSNRSIAITASCDACRAVPATQSIKVLGATLNVAPSATDFLVGAQGSVVATLKDASGNVMGNVPIAFASADPGIISVSNATVFTNASGVATVPIAAISAGSTVVNVSVLGDAKAVSMTSAPGISALAFSSPVNDSIVLTSVPQVIVVAAPGATKVTFATTLGTLGGGSASQEVAVSSGIAQVILTSALGGRATINALDNLGRRAVLQLVVSPPISAANRILLNAAKTTVPVSSGSVQSSVVITARVLATDGSTDQPVANVPVSFSMIGGPNGGEYLSPALALSDATGNVTATFYAGAISSITNGISIAAKIPNTSVETGIAPSSNDVLLTIGGQALSVAFGPSTKVESSSDDTLYIFPHSVVVTDANNNPVAGQVVTLRLRPFAFSAGDACTVVKTFCSEDQNNNGSLDSGEDGDRILLSNDVTKITSDSCNASVFLNAVAGDIDSYLTPQNSDAGAVPATVVTNEFGVASFNLTYLKQSALWVAPRLTATVSVNGTESSKSTIFRLKPSEADAGGTCYLPPSPYRE